MSLRRVLIVTSPLILLFLSLVCTRLLLDAEAFMIYILRLVPIPMRKDSKHQNVISGVVSDPSKDGLARLESSKSLCFLDSFGWVAVILGEEEVRSAVGPERVVGMVVQSGGP